MRTRLGKFSSPYTKKIIIAYLKAIYRLKHGAPTYRDVKRIPGPSSSTIIRHFDTWSNALKAARIRPSTNQLLKGEKGYIRQNWRKMTDKEIAKKLGLNFSIVRYYRMQYDLWKNRKGTSDQKHKQDGVRMYGKNCEICNLSITELHHIKPESVKIDDWAILCPTCHAVITRRIIEVKNRKELRTKLTPYIINLYKNIEFKFKKAGDNGTSST